MAKAKKSSPSSAPSAIGLDTDYQAEDDHRTMMRAAEIQSDRGRFSGVKRHQRKQEKAMSLMSRTLMKGGR